MPGKQALSSSAAGPNGVIDRPVRGAVNHILPHSFVDGPGNRTVIFLQGCNLECLYCHNPYTLRLCDHCGQCVRTCPAHALVIHKGKVLWLKDKCAECDTCIRICPNHASPKVSEYTPENLWEAVLPGVPFISGVTISGGEPMLQAEFIRQFFKKVKTCSSLTTLIESNGFVGPQAFQPLLPFLDLALVDLKSCDPEIHLKLTGKPVQRIIQSIQFLFSEGKLHGVQQVIVPGFSDTMEQMRSTARTLRQINKAVPLKILRFRPHGTHGEAEKWISPSEELMDQLVQVAQEEGLINVTRSL